MATWVPSSSQARREEPKLIIFDTLARCMVGGDENSPLDMGRAVAAADRVRVETGAAVLLVHHPTKANNY